MQTERACFSQLFCRKFCISAAYKQTTVEPKDSSAYPLLCTDSGGILRRC